MARNGPTFNPRWNRGYLVPVCILVQDIPLVPAGTEQYPQLWFVDYNIFFILRKLNKWYALLPTDFSLIYVRKISS